VSQFGIGKIARNFSLLGELTAFTEM